LNSSSLKSEIELLNGAKITDFSDSFLNVWLMESKLSSVNPSQGSISWLIFSDLLFTDGLLYKNSFLTISFSSGLKIS
jgi:hypothetical protein